MSSQTDVDPDVRRAETVAKRAGLHAQVEAAFINAITTHGGPACTTGNAQTLTPKYAAQARAVFATLGGNDERAVGAPRESVLRGTVAILAYTLGTFHTGVDAMLAATTAFDLEVRSAAAGY